MTICSLGNDKLLSRCVYSDILNRKFPPKKAVSPRKFRLRGIRDVFVAMYKLKLRRFWATDSNRKQDFFPFICLDATTFVLISVITLIETICLKICPRTTAQECKKSTSGGRWNATKKTLKTRWFISETVFMALRKGFILLLQSFKIRYSRFYFKTIC